MSKSICPEYSGAPENIDVEIKITAKAGRVIVDFVLRAYLDEAVEFAHLSLKLSPPPHPPPCCDPIYG